MSIFRKWYWRAAVASVGGVIFAAVQFVPLSLWLFKVGPGQTWVFLLHAAIGALPCLVSVAIYGVLTSFCPPKGDFERETRCRKCGYILRGITEPRCSECGERI